MVKNKKTIKGFMLGSVFTLCLVIGIGTVGAASKLVNIKVMQGGINIYVDEKIIKPADANGKPVEPLIYDGTTYLPIRAVANALDKEVSWDGKTSSVYIGKAPMAEQIDIASLTPYQNNTRGKVYTGEDASFSILDKKFTPFNSLPGISYNPGSRHSSGWYEANYFTYILDSNYGKLKGEFVMPYTTLGKEGEGSVSFYNVDTKGNQTLIQKFTTSYGENAIPIEVNLNGVNILRIAFDYSDRSTILYNVVLESAK